MHKILSSPRILCNIAILDVEFQARGYQIDIFRLKMTKVKMNFYVFWNALMERLGKSWNLKCINWKLAQFLSSLQLSISKNKKKSSLNLFTFRPKFTLQGVPYLDENHLHGFHYHDFWLIYVGSFCISRGPHTVQLMQILRNKVFSSPFVCFILILLNSNL